MFVCVFIPYLKFRLYHCSLIYYQVSPIPQMGLDTLDRKHDLLVRMQKLLVVSF